MARTHAAKRRPLAGQPGPRIPRQVRLSAAASRGAARAERLTREVCFISGSRSPVAFFVELGAAISVASTTVPFFIIRPLACRMSLTTAPPDPSRRGTGACASSSSTGSGQSPSCFTGRMFAGANRSRCAAWPGVLQNFPSPVARLVMSNVGRWTGLRGDRFAGWLPPFIQRLDRPPSWGGGGGRNLFRRREHRPAGDCAAQPAKLWCPRRQGEPHA